MENLYIKLNLELLNNSLLIIDEQLNIARYCKIY